MQTLRLGDNIYLQGERNGVGVRAEFNATDNFVTIQFDFGHGFGRAQVMSFQEAMVTITYAVGVDVSEFMKGGDEWNETPCANGSGQRRPEHAEEVLRRFPRRSNPGCNSPKFP